MTPEQETLRDLWLAEMGAPVREFRSVQMEEREQAARARGEALETFFGDRSTRKVQTDV